MRKSAPKLIELPKIVDFRGNLSFVESNRHVPFLIKRAYWIYDVPGGAVRGGHAFIEQEEFIIALSGSFDVILKTGKLQKRYTLNRSYFGLFVPSKVWRSMENFSTNSFALVLASTRFNRQDYIRDFDAYLSLVQLAIFSYSSKPKPLPLLTLSVSSFCLSTVNSCRIIHLEKNHQDKGNITVIENREQIPFDIERVYYLYDVPGGIERGGHAHKELSQLIVAASGSFDVIISDGLSTMTFSLNRPYKGLYLVPGIWRELVNFSSGSNCLVLASHAYDEADYIRDFYTFQTLKGIAS